MIYCMGKSLLTMRTIIHLSILLCGWLAFSCQSASDKSVPERTVVTVDLYEGEDLDPLGGADAYRGKGNNADSPYFHHLDYYRLKSNDTLLILPHFPTMQQTTEWSCGCVAALLTLRYLGMDPEATEYSLAVAMGSHVDRKVEGALPGWATQYLDYGTKLEKMYHYFDHLKGVCVVETSFRGRYRQEEIIREGDPFPPCDRGNLFPTFASVEHFAAWLEKHLRARRPVIAEWSDWDGHWVCIIGLDSNGTPDFRGDAVLILADPYDTMDHWQDGYTAVPIDRFFYLWKDRAIAPKPYQLQPFIVVERCWMEK